MSRLIAMSDRYRLVRESSTAEDFHNRQVVEPVRPEIWWHEVTRPAVVLGSTQSRDHVDDDVCRDRGVDVVRRRSGGGAVLLVPGQVTWVDIVLPAGAPGWATDVHGPMVWLGRILRDVLKDQLLNDHLPAQHLSVHEGKMIVTPWSSLVCFDGIGAGEVLIDGEKLIGLSQRRTRSAARLQCCWYSSYDPGELASMLDPQARPPLAELRPVATIARSVADAIPEVLLDRLNA